MTLRIQMLTDICAKKGSDTLAKEVQTILTLKL